MKVRTTSVFVRTTLLIVCGFVVLAAGGVAYTQTATQQGSAAKKKGKPKPSFQVRASVAGELRPGRTYPVKLSIANNRPKVLWLTKLQLVLGVDAAHAAAGCSAARDYRIAQLPKTFFPHKLAKGKKAKSKTKKARLKYRALPAKKSKGLPSLTMVDLPETNQDACKGATVTIGFKSKAQTKKPRKKK